MKDPRPKIIYALIVKTAEVYSLSAKVRWNHLAWFREFVAPDELSTEFRNLL